MNFNKCQRCGCFFITDGYICPSCTPKDNTEISKLNNYFSENIENTEKININELSSITGISTKNLARYINNNEFNFKKQIIL